MSFDLTVQQLQCLLDYLVSQVELEALYALRNALILLKSMLQAYTALYITGPLDKLLESLMLQTRFTNEINGVMNQMLGLITSLEQLFPGEALAQCFGFTQLLQKIQGSTDIVMGGVVGATSYLDRYNIIQGMESYVDTAISEAFDALDIMIQIVGQAIQLKGQGI